MSQYAKISKLKKKDDMQYLPILVQFSRSVMSDSLAWTAACQASLSFTNSQSLLKLMSIVETVMPSNHLFLCHPLLLPSSIFPSIRVFSNESVLQSGPQNTGVSASASVFPRSVQGWFSLRLTSLILLFQGFSGVLPAPQFEDINSSVLCLLYGRTLTTIGELQVTDLQNEVNISIIDFYEGL